MTRAEFFREQFPDDTVYSLALVAAEDRTSREGFSYEWGKDRENPGKHYCVARDGNGQYAASLFNIDFAGKDLWTDPYRRVVQAQLAREALLKRGG